jgi:hypothetical protein
MTAPKSLYSIVLLGLLFLILSGCKPSSDEAFIVKNDSGANSLVYDCFIDIQSPPGESPNNFNKKTVRLFFRDPKGRAILERDITLSVTDIKPKIDWAEFPKVKISLLRRDGDGDLEMFYIVNITSDLQAVGLKSQRNVP